MEISVKTKLWSIMAVMLLFIMMVGGVGYVTLSREIDGMRKLLDQDIAFQNLASELLSKLLQQRRFEKDYFLNIGDPATQKEYLEKFQGQEAAFQVVIKKIAPLAPADPHLSPEIRGKINDLERNYQKYLEGFLTIVRQLQRDPHLTPQKANRLMAAYKEGIPILEQDVQAIMEAGDQMEAMVTGEAITRGQRAKLLIIIVFLVAVVLAGVLGASLSRSIYLAIFREGVRRLAGRH